MKRLSKVKKSLNELSLDAFLVTAPQDIFYLTGLFPHNDPGRREAQALVTKKGVFLHHSPLLQPSCPSYITTSILSKDNPYKSWLLAHTNAMTIGCDASDITLAEHTNLTNVGCDLIKSQNPITSLRSIKDENEIATIHKAIKATDKLSTWLVRTLPSLIGKTELEVLHILKAKALELGHDQWAFSPIVAYDQHTAIPHHVPGSQRLRSASVVLFDIGLKVDGYSADMTRTIKLGKQTDQFLTIKNHVDAVYTQCVKRAKKHTNFYKIHQHSVSYFAKHKLSQYYPHSIGHGIGIDTHELPVPSPSDTAPLKKGHAITIEPGLYLNGKFGYRHENTIIID